MQNTLLHFIVFCILSCILGMKHIWRPWWNHENCLIFKTTHPPCPSTSKHLLLPWPWTSNFKRTHPHPSSPNPPHHPLLMITNQFKKKTIQGWLLHVTRSGFCSQCQISYRDKLFEKFKKSKLHIDELIYQEAKNTVQRLINKKKKKKFSRKN